MGKTLLIIDLQKQFADKYNDNKNYNRCINFIKSHKDDYDLFLATLSSKRLLILISGIPMSYI